MKGKCAKVVSSSSQRPQLPVEIKTPNPSQVRSSTDLRNSRRPSLSSSLPLQLLPSRLTPLPWQAIKPCCPNLQPPNRPQHQGLLQSPVLGGSGQGCAPRTPAGGIPWSPRPNAFALISWEMSPLSFQHQVPKDQKTSPSTAQRNSEQDVLLPLNNFSSSQTHEIFQHPQAPLTARSWGRQAPALSADTAPSSSPGLRCLSPRSDGSTSSLLGTAQPLSGCPGCQTLPPLQPGAANRAQTARARLVLAKPKKQEGTSKACVLLRSDKGSPTRPSRCHCSQGPGCFSSGLPRHATIRSPSQGQPRVTKRNETKAGHWAALFTPFGVVLYPGESNGQSGEGGFAPEHQGGGCG